jgi:hypothetical protein
LRKFEFDWSTHPLAFRNVPTAELSFLDISSMLSQLPQPQGLVKRNSIGIEITRYLWSKCILPVTQKNHQTFKLC